MSLGNLVAPLFLVCSSPTGHKGGTDLHSLSLVIWGMSPHPIFAQSTVIGLIAWLFTLQCSPFFHFFHLSLFHFISFSHPSPSYCQYSSVGSSGIKGNLWLTFPGRSNPDMAAAGPRITLDSPGDGKAQVLQIVFSPLDYG